MKKTLALLTLWATSFVSVYAQSQPTPSMQEQYDKLNGTAPKKTTPQKAKPAKTTPIKTTPSKTTQTSAKRQAPSKPITTSAGDGAFFRIGVRGGANYCTFAYPDNTNISPENILGYHGGLIFNIGGERFSVQPEVLYSQIGAKTVQTILSQRTQVESKINTITVPVLLKLALGGDTFKFFVNAGGYGSYALNGSTKTTVAGNTLNSKITFDNSDGRMEYGAVAGAGVSLGLGRAKLLVEGRYYYGLANNEKNIPAANNAFIRNIQGSVGILIPLGGK